VSAFSLVDFGAMIRDRPRLDAHAEALRRVVTPSSIVLDVGAGTGIMTLLACRAGARRVYAVEPSTAVQVLLVAARDNGFSDRVVVLPRRSTDVTLPERADVVVSDLRGVLPPFATHFADLIDVRTRLLAPGGQLLPTRDTMWIAPISTPEAFARRRGVWASPVHGLDLRSALPFVDNELEKHRARPEQLLGAPVAWARLDYRTLSDLAVRGDGTCVVERPGAGHGLCAWFDTELVDGVGYSCAPGTPDGIYGQIFLPWPEEVALDVGDRVAFEVRADPVGSDYVWSWTTEIRSAASARPPLRFRQSTFKSTPPSIESVRRRAPTFAPSLSPSGEDALEVLEGMRAGRTVGELAERLVAARPGRFRSLDDARGFVATLVERYGAP
jgi:protein arginine N-methyltransferase 1